MVLWVIWLILFNFYKYSKLSAYTYENARFKVWRINGILESAYIFSNPLQPEEFLCVKEEHMAMFVQGPIILF